MLMLEHGSLAPRIAKACPALVQGFEQPGWAGLWLETWTNCSVRSLASSG